MASDPDFDPYEVLQVARFASPSVIRAAHKARIAETHPDPAADDPARTALAARINAARDLLLDPRLHAEYDARHPAGGRPSPARAKPVDVGREAASAPTPAAVTVGADRRNVTPGRFVGYLAWCACSVALAQISAILVTVFAAFANLTTFVGAIFGVDIASGLVEIVGNLAFAVSFGWLLAHGIRWLIDPREESPVLAGGVVGGVLGFVFPIITAGSLFVLHDLAPEVAEAVVTSDASRLISVVAAYALVGGLAALGVAVLVRPATRLQSP